MVHVADYLTHVVLRTGQRAQQLMKLGVSKVFDPKLVLKILLESILSSLIRWGVFRVEDSIGKATNTLRIALSTRKSGSLEQSFQARIVRYVEANIVLLKRLANDRELIQEQFGKLGHCDQVVGLTCLGDPHACGQKVTLVEFASGLRLVYKPRCLAVDLEFQQLLNWFNRRSDQPRLRTLRILNRSGYGWTEYVPFTACRSESTIHRYFQRIGVYLAILQLLQATDFHCQNLIAQAGHPMLIDLECLFTPRLGQVGCLNLAPHAAQPLSDSLLRTGMLPRRPQGGVASPQWDVSGLSAMNRIHLQRLVPFVESITSTHLQVSIVRVWELFSCHAPWLNHRPIDPVNYIDTILAHFAEAYRLLVDHRDELMESAGLLRRFENATVRVVLRPSSEYRFLLNEKDRRKMLDRLWAGTNKRPHLRPFVQYEYRALCRHDVPRLTALVSSRDLQSDDGQAWQNKLELSGIELVRKRLLQMNDYDLRLQLRILRSAMDSNPITLGRKTEYSPRSYSQ